jgi:hypothetical protein
MAIHDLLIAVGEDHVDDISKALTEYDHDMEVSGDFTFFTVKDVETDPEIDDRCIYIQPALDGIGSENYAYVVANIEVPALVILGNAQRFGVKALISYGRPVGNNLH